MKNIFINIKVPLFSSSSSHFRALAKHDRHKAAYVIVRPEEHISENFKNYTDWIKKNV